MNVLVLSELDRAQHASLLALLRRCEAVDAHPALPDPQRAAAESADLGGSGHRVALVYGDADATGNHLLGCAFLTPGPDGVTSVHLALDPAHRGNADGESILSALVHTVLQTTPGSVRLWTMRATADDDAAAHALGFQTERELVQMRVPIPLPEDELATARPVTTRGFVPGQDDEAWLSVNNRAFEGHPEQGAWTLEQLHDRLAAPWFDPEGFRIAEDPGGAGLIGSCWTKIHRDAIPVLGEIYVIAVNPDHHGEGWGRSLTVAGLQWLAEQGVKVGMLYTDATNTAAVSLYRSLGFTVDHVDRSYLLEHSG
ncbi:MAG TPA: mycothiol synthase [Acidimicrobiales bacterium]|nr:mycothiol synthase [Acidimicrobiales bacterium]